MKPVQWDLIKRFGVMTAILVALVGLILQSFFARQERTAFLW